MTEPDTFTFEKLVQAKKLLDLEYKNPLQELLDKYDAETIILPDFIFDDHAEWRNHMTKGITTSRFVDQAIIIKKTNK